MTKVLLFSILKGEASLEHFWTAPVRYTTFVSDCTEQRFLLLTQFDYLFLEPPRLYKYVYYI